MKAIIAVLAVTLTAVSCGQKCQVNNQDADSIVIEQDDTLGIIGGDSIVVS